VHSEPKSITIFEHVDHRSEVMPIKNRRRFRTADRRIGSWGDRRHAITPCVVTRFEEHRPVLNIGPSTATDGSCVTGNREKNSNGGKNVKRKSTTMENYPACPADVYAAIRRLVMTHSCFGGGQVDFASWPSSETRLMAQRGLHAHRSGGRQPIVWRQRWPRDYAHCGNSVGPRVIAAPAAAGQLAFWLSTPMPIGPVALESQATATRHSGEGGRGTRLS
jgi:hypothetical protein